MDDAWVKAQARDITIQMITASLIAATEGDQTVFMDLMRKLDSEQTGAEYQAIRRAQVPVYKDIARRLVEKLSEVTGTATNAIYDEFVAKQVGDDIRSAYMGAIGVLTVQITINTGKPLTEVWAAVVREMTNPDETE